MNKRPNPRIRIDAAFAWAGCAFWACVVLYALIVYGENHTNTAPLIISSGGAVGAIIQSIRSLFGYNE